MKILANLMAVAVSILAVCMVVEIGLRIIDTPYPASLYTADLERGWALRPNASGWALDEAKEYIHVNRDGLRDRDHDIQKPSNIVRIAVLGDSYTEALNVPMDKSFLSVLERSLSNCPTFQGKKVEVVNFGVSGYGTAQELLTLRSKVWKYSPDIVLLAFYSGNDIFNNYRALNYPEDADNTPYYIYKDNQLVLDASFNQNYRFTKAYTMLFNLRGEVQNRVRIVQLFMQAVKNLKIRMAQRKVAKQATTLKVADAEDMVYSEPTEPKMKDAWRVTEDIFLLMDREVQAHGAKLVIAALSNRSQVLPDPAARDAFLKRLSIEDPYYPNRRVRDFAMQHGISTIDLSEPLAAYAVGHHAYLNGGGRIPNGAGHWNELGHRVAGETLAAALCNCGIMGPDTASNGATTNPECPPSVKLASKP